MTITVTVNPDGLQAWCLMINVARLHSSGHILIWHLNTNLFSKGSNCSHSYTVYEQSYCIQIREINRKIHYAAEQVISGWMQRHDNVEKTLFTSETPNVKNVTI